MRPTILVGLGGSGGWQALAWAGDEATARGARLVLLHACPPSSPLAAHAPSPSLAVVELFDPPLARAVATTRARFGGDRVQFRLLPGRPGPLLAGAASGADLVVVGPPTRHRPGGYGSTTHHVVTHAPGPVVVTRPISGGPDAPLHGHIVVGVDGRGDPGPALEFAFERAAARRGALAAVHVTPRRREDHWFDQAALSTNLPVEPAGLELLARAVEPWAREYPQVPVKCAVYAGRPLPGLLRAARGARLLVVGDHGHGRLGPAGRALLGPAERVLLGSVAHGVLDQATGPVAVVPPRWDTGGGPHLGAAGRRIPEGAPT